MKYKYNEEGHCPKCGSFNLNWGDTETSDHYISYTYSCVDCGTEGQEFYALIFDGHNVYDKEDHKWIDVNDILNPRTHEDENGNIVSN